MKLSVIVPLYNSAPYMRRCVDSLLKQDIDPDQYEIILVNDGSPDNSLQIAEEYAAHYPQVKVLSQQNRGASGARNTGIRAAAGEYLCFCDPDDYVQPDTTRMLIEKMDADKLDMLRFKYIAVDEDYKALERQNLQPIDPDWGIMSGHDYLSQHLDSSCFIWTWCFRTSIIKSNELYCSEGVYYDDTDWLPKVLLHSDRVATIDQIRQFYLIRTDSLVNTKSPKMIEAKVKGAMQMFAILSEDKKHVDKQVMAWYDRMTIMLSLSTFTTIAVSFYPQRCDYIRRMRQWDCFKVKFPLRQYSPKRKVQLKLLLMCLFPKLYTFLLHAVNK